LQEACVSQSNSDAGFQNALQVAACIAFVGAIVATVLVRIHDVGEQPAVETAPEIAA